MSVDFATIEAAIHAWVVAATGLTGSSVRWANQGGVLPSGTYAMLSCIARPTGRGWFVYTEDLGADPGEEMVEEHVSQIELELKITIFGADAAGANRGQDLMIRCQKYAQFSSQRALFRLAGWAPARWDTTQDIAKAVGSSGSVFEPRVTSTCYGYCKASLSSTTTYIEFVEVTNELTDPDNELTLDLINETVT